MLAGGALSNWYMLVSAARMATSLLLMLKDDRINNKAKHRLRELRGYPMRLCQTPHSSNLSLRTLFIPGGQNTRPLQLPDAPGYRKPLGEQFDELLIQLINFASKLFKLGHRDLLKPGLFGGAERHPNETIVVRL